MCFIGDGGVSKGLSRLLSSFLPSILAGLDPSWGDVVSLHRPWSKVDAAEAPQSFSARCTEPFAIALPPALFTSAFHPLTKSAFC